MPLSSNKQNKRRHWFQARPPLHLQGTLGERLTAARDPGAARVFAELLLCGAHGRPWHRHEVSARLAALAGEAASKLLVVAALAAQPPCAPVEPADLAIYVDALRAQLK